MLDRYNAYRSAYRNTYSRGYYPRSSYSRYRHSPSYARHGYSRYGYPRFGYSRYGNSFWRRPYPYRPGWCYTPYSLYRYPAYACYPYYRRGFSLSFGFGFYDTCAYPVYATTYYPTYYAPAYPAYAYTPTFFSTYPTYVSSTVVTPIVEEYPVAYAASPQYASADYYGTGAVIAPEVEIEYDDDEIEIEYDYDDGVVVYSQPQATYGQAATPPSYDAGYMQASPQAGSGTYAQPAPQVADTYAQPAPRQTMTDTPGTGVPNHDMSHADMPATDMPATDMPSTNVPAPSTQVPMPDDGVSSDAPRADATTPADASSTDATSAEADSESVAPYEPSLPIEKLQELMVGGTKSFGEGKYAEAVERFEQVTQADPQNVDAALAHAVARFATGGYAEAAESIRQGVALFPPIVDTMFDLRDRYESKADFIDQSRRLERHVEQNPDDSDALLVLGFVRHFSDQRDLAEQAFNKLEAQSPDDSELAQVFLQAMTPEEAAAAAAAAAEAAAEAAEQEQAPTTAPAGSSDGAEISALGEDEPASAEDKLAPGMSVTTQQQPVDLERLLSEPPDPGVLSVTTRPANYQKVEPVTDVIFTGKLSLGVDEPREQSAADGIQVRLKATDDNPPQAHLEVTIGERRLKIKRFVPGAHVEIKGESGKSYKLVLTNVDNKTETVGYVLTK